MTAQLDGVRSGTAPAASPYRGLMPYTEADAEYFFGREGEIVLIANNAQANRFGVLYGPSGVGKSSVLRAGVVRHIRDDNRRRQERYGDLETVVAYLKEWRDDPYAALAAAIAAAFHDAGVSAAEIPASDLVGATVRLCAETGVDLVVILDQFEEFSLYHRPDVTDFAEVIARLTAPATSANVLVSIREDALSWLDEFEGIVPDVFANTLRLDHLDEDAARLAITEPLRRYNEQVPDAERREVEPALVEALLHEVQAGRVKVDQLAESTAKPAGATEHADDVRIEAPYLQLVLTRLWDEETRRQSAVLRLSTLRELGGAQEIVRQHLDRVMREFSPPEMAVLADAFGHLVTPSGSKIAHRPSDLAEFSGRDPAQMAALMHRLAEGDQRILRDVPPPLDEPHAEPRYEIFHDVLALAVLDWRRRFLAEAETRRQQAELLAEKERVEQETRETKGRLRRARALVLAMAMLLVACIALAGFAFLSRRSAQDSQREADGQRKAAVDKGEEARLNRVLSEVNGDLATDPAAALRAAKTLEFRDDDSRYEDAFRRAMDAADTDVILDLDTPVVTASFVGDTSLVAVTKGGRVLVWDLSQGMGSDHAPVRIDEQPRIDLQAGEGEVYTAVTVASDSFLVLQTASGISSVDLDSGEVQQLDPGQVSGGQVAVAPGGSRDEVLVYDYSGHALLWQVAKNRTAPLPRLARSIDVAAIDPTGQYVAALVRGDTSRVGVWSVATGRSVARTPLTSYLDPPAGVFTGDVSFSTIGSTFDSADPVLLIRATGLKSEVSRWDVLHQSAPTPLGDNYSWRQVYDLADLTTATIAGADQQSSGTGRVAVAGDKSVTVFDASSGTFQAQTAAAQDWITDVETDPVDSSVFALAANEGYVELYRTNLNPPQPMWTFRGHQGTVNDLSFSADGQHLVTAGSDGTVRVWRLPPQMSFEWYVPDWILGARFTPDGRFVFGYSPIGRYVTREDSRDPGSPNNLESAGSGAVIKFQQVALTGQASGMDPAPDDARAAILDYYCSAPVQVSVLKKVKAVPLDAPTGGGACSTAVGWNPDPTQHQIVAGTYDGMIVAWDADTGKVTASVRLDDGASRVVGVAFSGDGTRLVAATVNGAEGRVHVLDATDLSPVTDWPTDAVSTIDLSADGHYVVTGGRDTRVVTVWDAEDPGVALQTLSQAKGTLGQVTISPDESASRVAVTTSEGMIYVWERESGKLLAAMRRHADAADEVTFDPQGIDTMYSAGDDGFMLSYSCDLCSMGVDDLKDAAEDREAQLWPVHDD
jgi:WD40 repeat protein